MIMQYYRKREQEDERKNALFRRRISRVYQKYKMKCFGLVVLVLFILAARSLYLFAFAFNDFPNVFLRSKNFGFYSCNLDASMVSKSTAQNVLHKACSDQFRENLLKTKFLFVSSQSPEESLDEYLHFGPPVFLYNERRSDSFQTLASIISRYANTIENILLYNIPLPIIHRLVYSTKGSGSRLRDTAWESGRYKISVLFTNGDNVHFDRIEHAKNRQLRLSGAVSNFLSTVVDSKPHRQDAYFDAVGLLFSTAPRKAGIIRSVLDQKIHVGIFDKNAPDQTSPKEIWAACTNGKQYIVHAFMVEGFERFFTTFEMCDNPIRWHKYQVGQDIVILDNLIRQMDVHITTSSEISNHMMRLVSTRVPVISKRSTNLYKYSSTLNSLLSYSEAASSYDIQKVLDETVSFSRDIFHGEIDRLIRQNNIRVSSDFNKIMHTEKIYKSYLKNKVCDKIPYGEHDNYINGVSFSTDPHVNVDKLVGNRIVFVSSELGGIMPGGAGVLITALSLHLYSKGFDVVILLDTTELGEWTVVQREFKSRISKWKHDNFYSKVKMIDSRSNHIEVLALQEFAVLSPRLFKYDEIVAKNMRWAMAVEKLYHTYMKFDMVEFFDFTGAGSLLLLRRMHRIKNFLPAAVVVAVRIHGTFEIIDSIEYLPINAHVDRQNIMEHFAITLADIIVYPSIDVIDTYRKAIGLRIRNGITGVPPIPFMLQNNYQKFILKPWTQKNLLVLGKVQRIKGVFDIVDAAQILMEKRPDLDFQVHFVGSDSVDPQYKDSTMIMLQKRMKKQYLSRFVFVGFKERGEIPYLSKHYRAALVASLFETFCLAAHEMHQAGLPLVIVDRPVFKTFLDNQVFRWKPNNIPSFVDAIEAAVTDDEAVRKKSTSTRIQYSDAAFPYQKILARKPLFKSVRQAPKLTYSMCAQHKALLESIDQNIVNEILKLR